MQDTTGWAIVASIVGSSVMNFGQNLQNYSSKTNSKRWLVTGLIVFVVGALLNFYSFSLASTAILAPFEVTQIIVNIFIGRLSTEVPIFFNVK